MSVPNQEDDRKMPRTARPLALALLLAAPLAAAGQAQPVPAAASGEITLERIMAHPDWLGTPPEEPYWADDGRAVYFRRKRTGEDIRDLWRIDLAGCRPAGSRPNVPCTPRKVEPQDLGKADAPGGAWSQDRRRKVYAREGDIYLKDVTTGAIRQLTRTGEEESEPRFQQGDKQVAYRRGGSGGAYFVRELASGLESQPAELRLEKDPAAAREFEPGKEDQEVLAEQERRLISTLRERKAREDRAREQQRAEQRADPSRPPLPWYLGDKVQVIDSSLSPDGRWLFVLLTDKGREDGPTDKMPEFVTESGYVEIEQVRPKVGTVDPKSPQLVLLDLERHRRHDLDLAVLPGLTDDPLRELREKAAAERAAARKKAAAEREAATQGAGGAADEDRMVAERAERAERAGRQEALAEQDARLDEEVAARQQEGAGATGEETPERAAAREAAEAAAQAAGREPAGGSEAGKPDEPKPRPVEVHSLEWNDQSSHLAVQFLSEDNKDRWLALVDVEAGKLLPLERWSDPAWINEYDFLDFGWLRDGRSVWFLSEEDGYSHLYLRPVDQPAKRRLTEGKFEISAPSLTPDGKAFVLTANREHPGIHETYRVAIASTAGGELERLTALGGESTSVLSPDGKRLLVLHSHPTDPPELAVQDARPGAPAQQLTETSSPEFRAIRWTPPEVVEVPSTHGAPQPIYSRVYIPEGWRADRPGGWPAVVFVHGAGYLQNVHFGWSSYFREFMFHSLLTRQGYVVLDMDFRASSGYGRDWRAAIYRRMGEPEVEDLADGVAWLAANRSVDPRRVGVYGGSYGGFLTFMSLFRQPDLFACGAALRPVADWAHYNHGYTSNILNTPEVDPEAFRKSSPIEYAEGLSKPLLIAHGMVDDNVVFQDSVRLVQRLIELGKQDFETAIYPVEPHAFREPSSWLDEYRRIHKLFRGCLAPVP